MIEYLNWGITFIALYGAYLNSKQDKRGFYAWIATNSYLMAYNAFIGQYSMAFLFAAYLLITLNGIRVWKKS